VRERLVETSALIIVLVAAGCIIVESDDKSARRDSAAAAPGVATVQDSAPMEDPGAPTAAVDTPPDAAWRAGSDGVAAAAPDELAALRAGLIVPVAGVERADLHDTFNEARGERVHEALDILAPRGTAVVAATDGRLLKLFNSKPGGLMVYATDASERFILFYGHLDSFAAGLREGARLERGQVVGYVGTTGNAPPDTPHLHFGILRGNPRASWSEGTPVNPYPLLVPAD
jgi:murein DD-endopeptidase MepM/ murein hydrolase activator NlpD